MDERDIELGFQLRLENIAAVPAFEEVLELAIETCLSDPNVYEMALKEIQERQTDNDQATLVRKLGGWGLRANLDFKYYPSSFFIPGENRDMPLVLDMLEEPAILPLFSDQKVEQQIEAFGKALLSDAFECLGAEAPEKVRQFQEAVNVEEQIDVLVWLANLVMKIRDHKIGKPSEIITSLNEITGEELDNNKETNLAKEPPYLIEVSIEDMKELFRNKMTGPVKVNGKQFENIEVATSVLEEALLNDDDKSFYHPVRLSPKFIGQHPDIQTTPTCLGLSILVAAFFERAGAEYLHGGVMENADEHGRVSQETALLIADNYADEHSISLHERADKLIKKMLDEIQEMKNNNRGHHAMVLPRLMDGSWGQIDPNYNVIRQLFDGDSKLTEEAYRSLQAASALVPGVEQLLTSHEGFFPDIYFDAMLSIERRNITHDEVTEILDSAIESENALEALKVYILGFITDEKYLDIIVDEHMRFTNKNKEKYIDKKLNSILYNYVFSGASREEFIVKCTNDPLYKFRRVEDLQMVPFYFVISMMAEFLNDFSSGRMEMVLPSPALEVGLPQYRIGACVLSDFSVYTGDKIPLSFWMANFPSHVAFGDHIPAKNDDTPQAELARRTANIVRSGTLRYFNSYGIVKKFLEQGENIDVE